MLPSWCTQTVTVLRAPLVVVRGSKTRDWSAAVPHTLTGCSVQPAGTTLAVSDRAASSVSLELYAGYVADIQAGDRIIVTGDNAGTYEIEGTPLVWSSPTGAVSHTVAPLKRWEG